MAKVQKQIGCLSTYYKIVRFRNYILFISTGMTKWKLIKINDDTNDERKIITIFDDE